MSATLDPGPVAAYLDAPVIQSEGRAFPVDTAFLPRPDDRPIEQQVADALDRLYGEGLKNHTLVFLPGAAEIRACLKGCEAVAARRGLSLRPLHGELSPDAQAHALEATDTPKVILSTNVAESSVTLDGIGAVVDSGLGREASHSPWSGLSGLRTVRISQARCMQRTGRAGRTGPGRCLRLYTEADFGARPAFDTPELQRSDLAEPLLSLHGMGITEPGALDWFEAPPAARHDGRGNPAYAPGRPGGRRPHARGPAHGGPAPPPAPGPPGHRGPGPRHPAAIAAGRRPAGDRQPHRPPGARPGARQDGPWRGLGPAAAPGPVRGGRGRGLQRRGLPGRGAGCRRRAPRQAGRAVPVAPPAFACRTGGGRNPPAQSPAPGLPGSRGATVHQRHLRLRGWWRRQAGPRQPRAAAGPDPGPGSRGREAGHGRPDAHPPGLPL